MASNKTQDECRKEFTVALREFVAKLDAIDSDTPATPVEEPKWWLDMMALRREARSVEDRLAIAKAIAKFKPLPKGSRT